MKKLKYINRSTVLGQILQIEIVHECLQLVPDP